MIEARSDAVKEQYCIGTWNVRPVNQGKLEVVKQEMARVNIDILGTTELKLRLRIFLLLSANSQALVFSTTSQSPSSLRSITSGDPTLFINYFDMWFNLFLSITLTFNLIAQIPSWT